MLWPWLSSSADLLVLPLRAPQILTVLNVPLHKLYFPPRMSFLPSWALGHSLLSFHLPPGMSIDLGTICAQPSTALLSSFSPIASKVCPLPRTNEPIRNTHHSQGEVPGSGFHVQEAKNPGPGACGWPGPWHPLSDLGFFSLGPITFALIAVSGGRAWQPVPGGPWDFNV